MFLQAVDTVLAFSMIMLLLSLLVTVLVQMFISLFGLRGKNLVYGIRQLVGAVVPELETADIDSLADKILNHAALQAGARRSSVEIQPREVLMVLDSLRKGGELAPQVKTALERLFQSPASEDSKLTGSIELLQSLRTAMPEQAETLQKLAETALSDAKEVVVRIDNWFDSAMSHAGERLKLHARWITAGVALAMTVFLQVDGADILRQLWRDPTASAQVVVQTDKVMQLYDTSVTATEIEARKRVSEDIRSILGEFDLKVFAALATGDDYWQGFVSHLPGSLLTALLLSLGAPFWYGVVGRLVGFRSALSSKQQEGRQK